MSNHQRELFFGLIRIHVLVHASHEPIFGLAMMEELAHHGYRIGPGTLYPLLHGLERSGLLKSVLKNVEATVAGSTRSRLPARRLWTRRERRSTNCTTSYMKNIPGRSRR